MTTFDWFVIAAYLGAVIAFGIWSGRKEENMKDYFLGGRSIPWWAALLSMVATEISAATFLGAPEQGYMRNLTYLQFGIGSILARFVLAFLFLGIFYRLEIFTVYGFLAHRFGIPTKNCAAGLFLLGRLFAGGSRLFIAALAVKVVTGFDMAYSILLLGGLAILYTMMGGIKAVIWTDVVQAIALAGGAVLSIGVLLSEIPMGAGEIWDYLGSHGKFQLFDAVAVDASGQRAMFSNPYHFIPAILGGFFLTMATHGTDQAMIQRLLTCKDSFRGKISMVLSGFLGIGITFLFLIVGMLLFVFVATRPEGDALLGVSQQLQATGKNGDFYLHYIVHGLPPGVTGMIIAAVLAAAMSSIDSELNAMSATLVNDFYKPYFLPEGKDRAYLKAAKLGTLISGAVLLGVAILIADFYESNPQTDLLSIALGVMTFFYGGLLGVFLVGLLTRKRGNSLTTILGLSLSTTIVIFISYKTRLIQALGLYDPNLGGSGFWAWFYQFKLGWPWYIILGTAITVAIAVTGMTARAMVTSYGKLNET